VTGSLGSSTERGIEGEEGCLRDSEGLASTA